MRCLKKVIFMIRTNKYAETKQKLEENNFPAFTGKEVLGRGRAPAVYEVESDEEKETIAPTLVAKKMMIVYVSDDRVEELVQCIISCNRTGCEGDGKIFVCPVSEGIRIRTGEKGEDAVL